jgi:hypothetical protein
MNVTMILEGEKEKVYSLRNIIEKRCPTLLLDVNLIKKKKEKKGDAGLVRALSTRISSTRLMLTHQRIVDYN